MCLCRNKFIKAVINVAAKIPTFRSDKRGASAIELSFFLGLLAFGMLNVADISSYIYQRMEVENATQMGVQAAWTNCDPTHIPPQVPAMYPPNNCPNLRTAITNAVTSTSLGANVQLQSGSPSEGYYCVNSSRTLQYVSSVSIPPPPDCTVAGVPTNQPGDYITVATTYAYAPLFPGITVAGAFTTPITKTAFMRLN
jgi:Flp pilus assembly protein TadG